MCSMYYNKHMFGPFIRRRREEKRAGDRRFSLRQVAHRIGVEPAYLSKIEREQTSPPSEEKIRLIAGELEINADYLLALAGKVAGDLQGIIRNRPVLFADLLRLLGDRPDVEVAGLIRGGESGAES